MTVRPAAPFCGQSIPGRLVLVASGTGFAPMWSVAAAAIMERPQREIIFVVSARRLRSLYMHAALCRLALFPNVTIILTVSEPQRVSSAIRIGRPTDHLPKLSPNDLVYAAGAPAMTDSVARIAKNRRRQNVEDADPFVPNAREPAQQGDARAESCTCRARRVSVCARRFVNTAETKVRDIEGSAGLNLAASTASRNRVRETVEKRRLQDRMVGAPDRDHGKPLRSRRSQPLSSNAGGCSDERYKRDRQRERLQLQSVQRPRWQSGGQHELDGEGPLCWQQRRQLAQDLQGPNAETESAPRSAFRPSSRQGHAALVAAVRRPLNPCVDEAEKADLPATFGQAARGLHRNQTAE